LEDPDNTEHECYLSYLTLEAAVTGFPDVAATYKTNVQNTAIPEEYNYGWVAKMGKRSFEIQILFFDTYE
jgi:hypothetical protein